MTPNDAEITMTPATDTAINPVCIRDYALYQELSFVRREAQAEANIAYDAWTCSPHPIHYAVYRAAQDRADAAQDALARCARQMTR